MKRRLSIQLRVTLWFTLLMLLLACISFAFLFYAGERMAQEDTRQRMATMTADAWADIEAENGQVEVDRDLEYFRDGVYLSVYDQNGIPLYGAVPREFDNTSVFSDGELRTIRDDSGVWYVYDAKNVIDGLTVWIRSVAAAGKIDATMQVLLRLALIVLPFFVLLAAIGGYLLAKRAFRPVRQITQTAREIGRGDDLTRRIALGQGRDEIYTLAQEFDRMFARLEQAFENEKQFTSDASHELRTPVSIIISNAEYALAHAQTVEESREALRAILDQAEKMAGLISQLLTLARADKAHNRLRLEAVDLSELAEMVAAQQQENAAARGIAIRTRIQPGIICRGDETMLMRMLINLLDNAVKYGRDNGWVNLTLKEENGWIQGSVQDNGIGIRPEHRELVWNRFWQADPTRSRDGAGLGLSMVRWIVQAHGGRAELNSEYGKGSEFLFFLPADQEQPRGAKG